MRMSRLIVVLMVAGVAGSAALVAQNEPVRVAVAEFGVEFPAMTFKNINAGAGGPAEIDLGNVLGKRPAIFAYWIAGNGVSEDVFTEVQALVDELGPEKIALFGVAAERPGLPMSVIEGRVRDLKVHVPVLNDEGFRIAQMLQVRSVPSITIVDPEGMLRLANAGSLRQTLEYKMDLELAIRRMASGKTLGTYGSLPRYFPVEELIGKECPDFEAPLVDGGEVKSWHQLIEPDKINVLFFWAVDCGHCRASLPGVNDWLLSKPEGINFVGVPNVPNEALKIQTTEYCRNQEFAFPNLMDESRRIADLYKIVSTPTYLVIRGDGVIDSVYTTGSAVGEALEAKRAELLTDASGS